MTKETFMDTMMDYCLTKLRGDKPQLEEIASCKYYNELICTKFWTDHAPAIITRDIVLNEKKNA